MTEDEIVDEIMGDRSVLDDLLGLGGVRSKNYGKKSPLMRHLSANVVRTRYTVLPFDEVVIDPMCDYLLRGMPQVPFKGNWLFVREAGPSLYLVDAVVGMVSCLPACGPIPLSMWSVEAYLKAFRYALPSPGTTTSPDKLLQMLASTPVFDRMRLDFDTCNVGSVIHLRVRNCGAVPQRVVCAVHGQATYGSDQWESAKNRTAFDNIDPPALSSTANDEKKSAGGASGGVVSPVVDKSLSVAAMFATCPTCGAPPQAPCYGVARGGAHPRRGVARKTGY